MNNTIDPRYPALDEPPALLVVNTTHSDNGGENVCMEVATPTTSKNRSSRKRRCPKTSVKRLYSKDPDQEEQEYEKKRIAKAIKSKKYHERRNALAKIDTQRLAALQERLTRVLNERQRFEGDGGLNRSADSHDMISKC